MAKNIILFLVFSNIVLLSSCLKKEQDNCNPPIVNISEEEINVLHNYILNNKIDADFNNAGFYYNISSYGDGNEVSYCSEIRVNYEGMLSETETFDKGNDVSFKLMDLIPGWAFGITMIKEKGIITLYLPPSMAYGSTGIPNKIPGNAITIFKIELLEVK